MGRGSRVRHVGGFLPVAVLALAWTAGPGVTPAVAQTAGAGAAALRGTTPPPSVRSDGRLVFEIAPTRAEIRVDGILDETAWDDATVIPLPFEVTPGENAPAPVGTDCRLTFDVENLYLGCRALDPDPDAIRAYVVDRDRIDGHDQVLMTLDPFNDQRRAFRFAVSALGVQSDAVVAQQGVGLRDQGAEAVDPSWDAIWNSAGTIDERGYVVEAAVPFQSLRFPREDGPGTWGVYLSRIWPRSTAVETRSASWDRDNGCLLCQANLVTGFEGVRPGGTLQITPTVTASRSDARQDFPDGPMVPGPTKADVGVDGVWNVTTDLTLNLTVNPDFSQVEADVAQLDVNNRFALFFPEKRPFFLEGADFFGTPIQAVFTRSISDPTAGAKVTGKMGANALGLLVARDRVNNLLIPGSEFSASSTVEEEVTTSVARFRRDLGGSSTIGALLTSREGPSYHNRLGGLDAFYRPLPPLTLQVQAVRSATEYPDAVAARHDQPGSAFGGDALSARADWVSRRWILNGDFRRISPGFRADAGFVAQAGVRGGSATAIRRFLGDSDDWFTEIRLVSGAWRSEDFQGHPLTAGYWFGLVYNGPLQSRLGVWPNLDQKEHVGDRTFSDLDLLYFDARLQPTGSVSLGLNGDRGDVVDYANRRPATELRLAPSVQLRLGRNVETEVQHTLQRLTREGRQVFTANLTRLRAVYSFSPRSFLRTIVQIRSIDRNPASYFDTVDPHGRSVLAELLYAYKVNPQTVLFLGYSEGRSGLRDGEGVDVPLTTTGRTFFLKLGYAVRP
ncbi:MAG TPA: DUF5916 domain-containing protein [Longimicrobiales bacterium]|nr:DUF5916 domain-containing protein [Longimicrobiales bacterium]